MLSPSSTGRNSSLARSDLRLLPPCSLGSGAVSAEQRPTYVDSSAILKLVVADARHLGPAVKQIVTHDERMAEAAKASGWPVAAPV